MTHDSKARRDTCNSKVQVPLCLWWGCKKVNGHDVSLLLNVSFHSKRMVHTCHSMQLGEEKSSAVEVLSGPLMPEVAGAGKLNFARFGSLLLLKSEAPV